jgi:serine/threonine protein kinase
MNPQRWQQIKKIFEEAAKQAPKDREAFLRQVCGSDPELLAEVEALLSADQETNSLFDRPLIQWKDTEPPINRIGSYKLLEKLGEGGMGLVLLAEEATGRKVAIKLMKSIPSPENIQRFKREQQILASLNHPNIVTLFAPGWHEGHPYFVMEYVEGKDLGKLLERGPLAPSHALEIIGQASAALDAAHRKNIVHRDIKPVNIIESDEDDGGKKVVKVLDFGIAVLKKVDPDATLDESQGITGGAGYVIGTPAYLSPEQARAVSGKDIGKEADIYLLGLVAYELLTGKRVFSGDARELVRQHKEDDPIPPVQRNPALRGYPRLNRVFAKVLSKKPENRYQTARDFHQALAEALTPRLWRKRMAAMTAAILITMGGWAVYGFWPEEEPLPARPLELSIFRRADSGRPENVKPDHAFRSGDGISFVINPPQSGYLYVLRKGSNGTTEILFPSREDSDSYEQMRAHQPIELPAQDGEWYGFAPQAGTDRLYVIWVPEKGRAFLTDLESAVELESNQLGPDQEKRTLAALHAYASRQRAASTPGRPDPQVKIIELRHDLEPGTARKVRVALTVLDENGQALEGCSFALFKPGYQSVPRPISQDNTIVILTTDQRGMAASQQIEIVPGEHLIKVVRKGYRSIVQKILLVEDPQQRGYVRFVVKLEPE